MAIARVQSATNQSSTSVATLTATLGAAPTNGNIVIAAASFLGTASQVGDSGAWAATGITWMKVVTLAQGASSTQLSLAIGRVRASASASIVFTCDQTGGIAMAVAEYSGASLNFDKFVSGLGSSTAPASGATATTEAANELWIGAISHRATSGGTFSSPTNSFTIVGQAKSTLGTTSDRSICLLERIVSATGTANAGATVSPTGTWIAQALTIEQAAVAAGGGPYLEGGFLG